MQRYEYYFSGEVWAMDMPHLLKPPIKLLGHTATVITDMLVVALASPSQTQAHFTHVHAASSFILTADRDEKIRLTCFPHTAIIQGYFLGHTDVVTSICTVTLRGVVYIVSSGLVS